MEIDITDEQLSYYKTLLRLTNNFSDDLIIAGVKLAQQDLVNTGIKYEKATDLEDSTIKGIIGFYLLATLLNIDFNIKKQNMLIYENLRNKLSMTSEYKKEE